MTRQRWSAKAGRVALAVALLAPFCAPRMRAQEMPEQGGGRGQFAGMQRVMGEITAISGPQVTIKTLEGQTFHVVTTDNTRVIQGRGVPGKMGDLKAGDGLMAMGNLDAPNKTIHAAMVMSIDSDQMKKLEDAYRQELANLGKTLIAGRVTAVDLDNATMTVERPDGVSQMIGFDENTSFRRGRLNFRGRTAAGGAEGAGPGSPEATATPSAESITLADVKVGDRVQGPGEVKGGRFVAKELTVMTPGAGRRKAEERAPGAPSQPPQ